MKNPAKLVLSIVFSEAAGLLGTPFTMAAIPSWYAGLAKPEFAPPNWVFAPVWTTLYALMGIAWYLVWKQGWENEAVKRAGYLFLAQLLLNFFWSVSFFGLRSPLLGLIIIIALLALIVLTMRQFRKLSEPAFWLMVPYLLWVGFATLLNAGILRLN